MIFQLNEKVQCFRKFLYSTRDFGYKIKCNRIIITTTIKHNQVRKQARDTVKSMCLNYLILGLVLPRCQLVHVIIS